MTPYDRSYFSENPTNLDKLFFYQIALLEIYNNCKTISSLSSTQKKVIGENRKSDSSGCSGQHAFFEKRANEK
jgi:hypothetical protein